MSALLQLLHHGRHARLVPFLAVRAGDGGLVGDELVELPADRGRVIVAGDFAVDLFEFDGAVVMLVGGRGGGGGGGGIGLDVLFVGRVIAFVFGFGGGLGVGICPLGGGGGTAGATGCFRHFGGE